MKSLHEALLLNNESLDTLSGIVNAPPLNTRLKNQRLAKHSGSAYLGTKVFNTQHAISRITFITLPGAVYFIEH
ncbi:hypothetical protein RRG08_067279 [Elysia crispata]|uniref:Uncharacterized protein n=1 Tax=Elysia crispata TaxID=231223 RepID=A0AAE1DCL0_9GAST|nr:hypothetical protein RRG08_067279 [Elysia crispata]